jgi:transposase-like protein
MVFPEITKTDKGYVIMKDNSNNQQTENLLENLSLDQILREGARKMLQTAIEAEVDAFLQAHTDKYNNRTICRNGHMPEREIQTGIGAVKITRPRVDDRSVPAEERFSSMVLPPRRQ